MTSQDRADRIEEAGEDDVSVVDLGSVRVYPQADVEIRLQADKEGDVSQLLLVSQGSAMQVGAFAAAPGRRLWPEVQAEIRAILFEDGEAAQEITGEFGTELLTQALTDTGLEPLRFLAIDGPGWMLRALIQGAAATDPALAAPFMHCLRKMEVIRPDIELEPREPLPMRIPSQMRSAEMRGSDNGEV